MANLCIYLKDKQQELVTNLLKDFVVDAIVSNTSMTNNTDNNSDVADTDITIMAFVDARGLACPMPLLRTKIALRTVTEKHHLYLVASDVNTKHDIKAFCIHGKHQLIHWHTEKNNEIDNNTHNTITYHFIISHSC